VAAVWSYRGELKLGGQIFFAAFKDIWHCPQFQYFIYAQATKQLQLEKKKSKRFTFAEFHPLICAKQLQF
jgi:hypothetical protein